MKIYTALILLITISATLGCNSHKRTSENPSSPGFNATLSDAKATTIADEVMHAMGGRKNWDETRYISWVFFGRRNHLWDKWTGDIRIESPADSTIYLLNINSMAGKVKRRGIVESHSDTVQMLLKRAKSIWINDSYWLVMPYKLKDSGVTLKYLGESKTENGRPADLLQLTFSEVGDTPDNKYHVYVDKESKLVTQWSYFRSFGDEKPGFTNPWEDYKKYGKILLSGSRGNRNLTPIEVLEKVPMEKFREF